MSGDGKLNRMEKDYESIVDRKLQESDLLASVYLQNSNFILHF